MLMASDGQECQRFLDREGREIGCLHLMIFGDWGVGKTSLITRFADDTFYQIFVPNIPIDFRIRRIQLDDINLKLCALDIAGGERFRSVTSSYLRMAHGALLAFDTTCMNSFENLTGWMKHFTSHCYGPAYGNTTESVPNRAYGKAEDIPRIVIGTKSDLIAERQVPSEVAQEYASQNGLCYIETSAKTGDNVEIAYVTLAGLVLEKFSACRIERLPPGTVVPKPDQSKTYQHHHHCFIS